MAIRALRILAELRAQPDRYELEDLFAAGGDASFSPMECRSKLREVAGRRLRAFMREGGALHFPCSASPRVCVVIVCFNQAEFTLACLQSIGRYAGADVDVVLVDNASDDLTPALLERVEGVTVIRNAENAGFVGGVHIATRDVRAPILLMINNDAMLTDGALASAQETLESEKDVGVVGGRLVLPGGRLQEAGGIIWNDGRCQGFGRGEDPNAPAYRFRRDVDYVSGAFLLTPTPVWRRLQGFDRAYSPGYYEDADYCVRARRQGLRVVYEPRALIHHVEHGSHDGDAAVDELIQDHWRIFQKRNADDLVCRHRPESDHALLPASNRADFKARVLLIDDAIPDGREGRGLPRTAEIVAALDRLGYFVAFYPVTEPEIDIDDAYRVLPARTEVIPGGHGSTLEELLASRQGFFDYLFVSRPHNMKHLDATLSRRPGLLGRARVIYDAEAVFSLREELRRAVPGQPFEPRDPVIPEDEEFALAGKADRLAAVSSAEADHIRARLPDCAPVVLGHATEPRPTPSAFETRDAILFVGRMAEDSSPNVDGITWFAEEILPRIAGIDRTLPNVIVCGLDTAPALWPLKGKRIEFAGRVDDLGPYYDRARVFFAPTRYAAGLPLKVIEAAAHGVPVVATQLLADQLGWQDGIELLAACGAEDFAAKTVRLMRDPVLWERLRERALERVAEEHSRGPFASALAELLPPVTEAPVEQADP